MTDLIKRARELADKATPGPWNAASFDDCSRIYCGSAIGDAPIGREVAVLPYERNPRDEEDAAFIAAAREIVPALCDEVERLRFFEQCYVDVERELKAEAPRILVDNFTGQPCVDRVRTIAAERDAYRAMLCNLVADNHRGDRMLTTMDKLARQEMWRRARELLKHGPGGKERG